MGVPDYKNRSDLQYDTKFHRKRLAMCQHYKIEATLQGKENCSKRVMFLSLPRDERHALIQDIERKITELRRYLFLNLHSKDDCKSPKAQAMWAEVVKLRAERDEIESTLTNNQV